jgi:hypothetical protein
MASKIISFDSSLFTPEDLMCFCRVALGWVERGLCGAILRTQADNVDSLLVMWEGSNEPLWSIEKHKDTTYRLVSRSRKTLASGRTMDEVVRHIDLAGQQNNASLH